MHHNALVDNMTMIGTTVAGKPEDSSSVKQAENSQHP